MDTDSAIADGRLLQLLPTYCHDCPGFLYFPIRRHMSARLRIFGDFLRAANANTRDRRAKPNARYLKGRLVSHRVVQEKT
jgi:hypothetical protein